MKITIGNREKWLTDERRWSGWMADAHQGNTESYEQLMTELGAVIENYLLVRLGPVDVLEDIVQECLIAIHRGRHTYQPSRPFRAWLFALVRNKSIDMMRRKQVFNRREETGIDLDIVGNTAQPDHSVLLDGIRLLDQLNPDQREALTLTKYAGYTVAEAAACCGVSNTAMKVRVFRAMRETKKILQREEIPA